MDHNLASTAGAPDQTERPTTERLFDTAGELFWAKGYAATTTREIAAALGIQQASLYYHMESKEDLLYRICTSSLNRFLDEVEAAVQPVASPLERLRALIRAHMTTLLAHQKRNVTMLTELRALAGGHRAEVIELRERYSAFIRLTIEKAQASGDIRSDISAKYLCLALLNIINWAVLWFRHDQALSPDQLAELFIKVYLYGASSDCVHDSIRLPVAGPQVKLSSPRKLRRKPENPTLERVLDAAVALFSRKGYAATSTREVAALLGMQKASLYYHIGSKEDLLYAICRSSLEQIRNDVETAIHGIECPLERTGVMIRTHIESMLQDADKHSTTLAEMHALSGERRVEILSLRDAYEDLVRTVLKEAQAAGSLRVDIEVKFLCLSLLGLMNRVLGWYRRKGPLSPSQLGQLLAVIFLKGAAVPRD